MNLKPRLMLLTATVFIVTAIAVSWTFRPLAEAIIEQWAPRFIIKQALYDKSRTLQPILRELALSKQLASSGIMKAWAHDPSNPTLKTNAFEELENYRQNFQDKSYFVGLLSNGHYFHNNANNEYLGNEYRYTLDPNKPEDSWFYNLIDQKRDIHINVNPDVTLGITKLWIDVLIRDGDQILGIVGTGLDLTKFLGHVIQESDPGTGSLFVDHAGAIQLHRDETLIDFGSVSKLSDSHKTIDLVFDQKDDQEAIYRAMKELEQGDKQVSTVFVNNHGDRHLVGIVYLPEIDWYEITVIELGSLLPISHFYKMIIMFVGALLIALALLNLILNRLLLKPIAQLDKAMVLFEQGKNPATEMNLTGQGELHRLANHFMQMAESVHESKRDLEQKVHERTLDLERLTKIDPLTELYNRRGMTEQLEANLNRAQREHTTIGILWIDVDHFKEINDTHGHAAGDDALKIIARMIKDTIRSYDLAARWGGDEFLVLSFLSDNAVLEELANRLRSAIANYAFPFQSVSLTVSIGCVLSDDTHQLDTLLQHADLALYQAKDSGRDCIAMYTSD
jgi:diguanylate cyclase (GGDEF)-like protein